MLTLAGVANLSTNHIWIFLVPKVVTNSSPGLALTDFNTTLPRYLATNDPHLPTDTPCSQEITTISNKIQDKGHKKPVLRVCMHIISSFLKIMCTYFLGRRQQLVQSMLDLNFQAQNSCSPAILTPFQYIAGYSGKELQESYQSSCLKQCLSHKQMNSS